MSQHVYVATMESEHFSWIAIGATRAEALKALRLRWDALAKRTPGAVSWAKWEKQEGESPADYYGAHVRRLAVGKAYIDSERELDPRERDENPVLLYPTKDHWEGASRNVKLSSLPQGELKRGTKHELEHGRSVRVARRTAADHLVEDPHYYAHLAKMEHEVRRGNPSRRASDAELKQKISDLFHDHGDEYGWDDIPAADAMLDMLGDQWRHVDYDDAKARRYVSAEITAMRRQPVRRASDE
jgi:hypothetical protein